MGNFDVEKTIVVPDSGGTGNNFLADMVVVDTVEDAATNN